MASTGLQQAPLWFLMFFVLVSTSNCFYLPGVAPQDFSKGDELSVKVNKLSSTKTQLPYDYYYLQYCKPKEIINSAENLGEVLRGDRIENSPYVFQMRENKLCNFVCKVKLDSNSAKNFKEKIDDEYRVHMILDNLPVAVGRQRADGSPATTYEHGFRVGFKASYAGSSEERYFIHNHLSYDVKFHRDTETDTARIVGFEVTPYSVRHEYEQPWDDEKPRLITCNANTKRYVSGTDTPQEVEEDKELIFTYDVSFKYSGILQESPVKWASRWDTYLLMTDDQIHWFSIINSLMIVLFLSGMVAMIMMRTLYRDISKYNQLETQDEAQEETGWKLVHGDVFRPPTNPSLLCVYVGTGVQFFGMTLVTMIFAMLGFLSPSNRGGLMTAMVLLWVFMGLFAGYSSARLYKMFKGTEWKKNTLKTAFVFPGIVFCIFFVLNALIWGEKSSGAVPFGTMFALVFLWFGISVPLVFIGSYFGYKKPAIEDPVKTNKIPRQIPEQAWYMQPVFSILIGGILPFGAVFIELFFILTSIWLNQFYYIFGFLFIVFVILLVTCAEITIVLCYFQLCSEDYHWWWRAYLTSGSSALYLFLYAIFYYFTKLEITKLVSGILYFGYMMIISYAFFVLTGTIGFYACFWVLTTTVGMRQVCKHGRPAAGIARGSQMSTCPAFLASPTEQWQGFRENPKSPCQTACQASLSEATSHVLQWTGRAASLYNILCCILYLLTNLTHTQVGVHCSTRSILALFLHWRLQEVLKLGGNKNGHKETLSPSLHQANSRPLESQLIWQRELENSSSKLGQVHEFDPWSFLEYPFRLRQIALYQVPSMD
eukprot:Gb_26109 [translate_table: standard]